MKRIVTTPLLAVFAAAACASDAPLSLPVPIDAGASPFIYPESLWDEGVEGQAVVMVHVTTTGGVDSVYVRTTSGYEAMDSAALQGARELRFEPGRRGEDAVEVWVRLPVRFQKSPPDDDDTEPGAAGVSGTGTRG